MQSTQTPVLLQHLFMTSTGLLQISEDSLYVLTGFLDLLDFRRLRIVNKFLRGVTDANKFYTRILHHIWQDWDLYSQCPKQACERYASVLFNTSIRALSVFEKGVSSAGNSSVCSCNSGGVVSCNESEQVYFVAHSGYGAAKDIVNLCSGEKVVSNGRVTVVFDGKKKSFVWLPGEVSRLAPAGRCSWYSVTKNGDVWKCWCFNTGTCEERTRMTMLPSPPGSTRVMAYCAADAFESECWVGCDIGVYVVDIAGADIIWSNCFVHSIASCREYVVAASSAEGMLVFDRSRQIVHTLNVSYLICACLKAFSSTNLVTYGNLTVDARTGTVYKSSTVHHCAVESRQYTASGCVAVVNYVFPNATRFLRTAT